MTKEEEKYTTLDIEQCKWWVNHLFNIAKERAFNANVIDDAKEIQSAQDKIIKLLGQEPCEDAVSRKAVLKAFAEKGRYGENSVINAIIDLPNVTPTRKHGKWVVSKINGQYQCYECSCFTGLTEQDVKEGYTLPKFCSECGADMRGTKLPYTDKSGLEYADQPTLRSAT